MKKVIFYLMLVAAAPLSLLTACSKDDDESFTTVDDPVTIEQVRQTAWAYLPEGLDYDIDNTSLWSEPVTRGNFDVPLDGQEALKKTECLAIIFQAWRGASCDFWTIYISLDGETVLGYQNRLDSY
jgi:hypothetical protein